MTYRALRLLLIGFLGVSAALPAVAARAGDLTVGQLQTIAIPKRADPGLQPISLSGLKPGNGLQIADMPFAPGRAATTPLSGLSLDPLAATSPPARAATYASTPAVTQQNGNIRYSVDPDSGFTPFVGIGAGRATGLLGTGLPQSSSSDSSDALRSYQGLAGFDYKLDKDTHLDFDYRMSNTQRPNVPMMDNASMADSGRDRAAILSLHYDLDPVLRQPHQQ